MVFDPIIKTGRRGWQDGKIGLGACVWPSSETPESWLRLQYLVLGTEQNARMRWISAEFIPVRARNGTSVKNYCLRETPGARVRDDSPRRRATGRCQYH